MHPKNVYKNGVSFAQLAKESPGLAKCLKGSTSINFHDPESIRQLAKALLKKEFNLEVDLPEDRLCPGVPNRLNYILWLNDLILDTHEERSSPGPPKVTGIDIGTGASAIYPLLGCAQFPTWRFFATEIDSKSLSSAANNISQNTLEDRITLLDVSSSSTILPEGEIISYSQPIDFTMCNPPFYTSINDMLSSAKTKAVPPLSACTGSTTEMVTDGGEVAFVNRMVEESLKLKEKVRWYTSMLGKRSSVEKVVEKLKESGVANYVVGEFVQGAKTKRWAVGWSFGDRRAGDHISRQPTSHLLRSHLPFPTTFKIPLPIDAGLSTLLPRVEELMKKSCGDFPVESFEWSSVRLPYFATMYGTVETLYSNGKGETNGNTWARAARRRRKQLEKEAAEGRISEIPQEPKFGFAAGIFISLSGPVSEAGVVGIGGSSTQEEGKKGDEDQDMVDETDAWDHDFISLPASSMEPEASKGSYILLRWTIGVDHVIWESFCGMLRRKLLEGLTEMKA
ncbi:hypothetical protein AOL_s00109g90 [Orbilia oligospora ATCC 24927]|uniref:U6 small nuclear RNA (adenine-(43)-N(6))-methyltransferase n=1 Tax=Arthrobotrys oligospora (strain ATCC 24927 / CBS 115.81 / DSM 1491) TaxID=756982 RepID=G1XK61_ARTOA|nr:hypothetical protein AOL_s00109g90 [Orbilia oligospora ATCC 24927]EGX46518.1 hypothetical protein AOL_s00109g90 [Orbilia oligospora ATCC 24927]